MNSKVLIMMSVYNGELYIREQIESILNQKDVLIDIYIRDDESTDGTVKIIKNYQKQFQNIKLINGKNCGASKSFMKLLYTVPNNYDFYAFADQDDVWLENKIIEAVKAIKSNEIPILYYGWSTVVDEYLKPINDTREFELPNSKIESVFKAWAPGNTIVFNQKALLLAQKYEIKSECAHDIWMYVLCTYLGKIIMDERSFILYRKHANNVTGRDDTLKEPIKSYELLKRQLKKIKKGSIYINYAKFLYNGYFSMLDSIDKIEIADVALYDKNLNKKIKCLKNKNICRRTFRGTLMLKTMMFLSKY